MRTVAMVACVGLLVGCAQLEQLGSGGTTPAVQGGSDSDGQVASDSGEGSGSDWRNGETPATRGGEQADGRAVVPAVRSKGDGDQEGVALLKMTARERKQQAAEQRAADERKARSADERRARRGTKRTEPARRGSSRRVAASTRRGSSERVTVSASRGRSKRVTASAPRGRSKRVATPSHRSKGKNSRRMARDPRVKSKYKGLDDVEYRKARYDDRGQAIDDETPDVLK